MKLEVIDDDWAAWAQVMGSIPTELMDVHYLPEFYRGTAEGMGWWAHLAVVRDGGYLAVMPFLVTQGSKIASVHNFGGPLAMSDATGQQLVLQLNQWARRREHMGDINLCPFMDKRQRSMLRGDRHVRDAVWVDLTQSLELRGTTRRCAEHAQEAGVEVEIHRYPDRVEIKQFQQIYWTTMSRVGSEERWLYPPSFFPCIFRMLAHHTILLLARVPGEEHPEAGAILVYSQGTCYYHWAGSLNRYPRLGVSHLLVQQAIERARGAGCKRLYLGGGLRPGDGLEVFKRGFSPLRERVYRYTVG